MAKHYDFKGKRSIIIKLRETVHHTFHKGVKPGLCARICMKITVEKEIIMTHLDDEAVLLNIKNGRYFSLNNTGERIWALLQEHEDSEKVTSIMMNEYDIDRESLLTDIDNMIAQLAAAKLIVLP